MLVCMIIAAGAGALAGRRRWRQRRGGGERGGGTGDGAGAAAAPSRWGVYGRARDKPGPSAPRGSASRSHWK